MPSDPAVPLSGAVPGDRDLRDLIASADVGVHFTDSKGIVIWANSADHLSLGYAADEYIGHAIGEFHADAEVASEMLTRLQAGERLSQYPARLVCKDGSIRHVEITASARFMERDGRREFLHTRCFTQDVTDRRTLEQARNLLVQAGQALSQSLDIDDTLRALSKLTVPRFADWYAVHLIDDEGNLEPVQIFHVDPERRELAWAALQRWPDSVTSNSAAAITIRTGRSYLVAHVDADLLAQVARGPEHLELLKRAGFNSAMLVPLKVQQETIGSMMFIAAESSRVYGPDDLTVAEALASRAALAIANARLHAQATEAWATAERAAQRLALLLKASESIAMTLQPDEALAQLARFSTPLLADYCVTYRMDADGSIQRVGLSHADPGAQPLVEQLVAAGPPTLNDAYGIGAVLRTGEPILASEVSDELTQTAAQNPEHVAVLRQLKPRSSIVVPLKARGRTVGGAAFVATDRSNRRYGASDLALAEELATRVALLVDNARLYEEGQAANRAMEDMLSIVAHDLRNPLNTIVTSSTLLTLDVPVEQRRIASTSIRRAAQQMRRLLDDLLDITRIGQRSLSMHLETVDVSGVVDETVSMHQPVAETRSISLQRVTAPGLATISGDRARLIQALSNLIDNALKFTPVGGEVKIRQESSEGAVRISVTDTGPGISPEDVPCLFDRFWRAKAGSAAGLGLGLSIAKGIVEAHGGRIDVASTPGHGSRFTVVLPEVPRE